MYCLLLIYTKMPKISRLPTTSDVISMETIQLHRTTHSQSHFFLLLYQHKKDYKFTKIYYCLFLLGRGGERVRDHTERQA